jgi:molecular chaperone GrpE
VTEAGNEASAESEDRAFSFTDRRRIDPDTFTARDVPAPGSTAADPGNPNNAGQPITATVEPDAELAAAKQAVAERTADLQRVTAEYANYRKRVDRDRAADREATKVSILGEMLPVLDDLDRAEQHGDLTGALKAVADKLTGTLTKLGLAQVGAVGDMFDPAKHEAVQFSTSAEITEPTVTAVFRHGYAIGERLVRPAVVVVTGPEHGAEATASDEN